MLIWPKTQCCSISVLCIILLFLSFHCPTHSRETTGASLSLKKLTLFLCMSSTIVTNQQFTHQHETRYGQMQIYIMIFIIFLLKSKMIDPQFYITVQIHTCAQHYCCMEQTSPELFTLQLFHSSSVKSHTCMKAVLMPELLQKQLCDFTLTCDLSKRESNHQLCVLPLSLMIHSQPNKQTLKVGQYYVFWRK